MNLQDAYYHGIREQIRRCLVAMGPDRIERGLTAFDNGASNWNNCFFARAYDDINLNRGNPEKLLMQAMNLSTVTPIRAVYYAFDRGNKFISREACRSFIESVLDESRPQEVLDLLKSLDGKFDASHSINSDFCATNPARD